MRKSYPSHLVLGSPGVTAMQTQSRAETIEPKQALEIILQERRILEQRVIQADNRMFQFIAVVVTPFCALVGYGLLSYDTKFRFVLLLVPFFTVLAALIIGLLYSQHYITGYYGRYLAGLLANRLRTEPLVLEKLEYEFLARGLGLQAALILVSAIVVAIINATSLLLAPDILGTLDSLQFVGSNHIPLISRIYWVAVALAYCVGVAAYVVQFHVKPWRLRQIIGRARLQNHGGDTGSDR